MTLKFDDDKVNQKISDVRAKEEEDALSKQAEALGLPFVSLFPNMVEGDALRLITEEKAKHERLIPFKVNGKDVSVAVGDPDTGPVSPSLSELRNAGYQIEVYVTPQKNLEMCYEAYRGLSFASATATGSVDITNAALTEYISKVKTIIDVKKILDEITSQKGVRLTQTLEVILAGSIATTASDIHIEPEEHETRLRYRLDGMLYDVFSFDHKVYNLLLSRIKLLSGLKLNVKTEGQDGRFSIVAGEEEIEVRTSVVPGGYGESVVMRILNPKAIEVTLDTLGMNDRLLPLIKDLISKPQGMILTTGPTGSGKTTTLYTCLRTVYTKEIKIITIEDPIEYKLNGIVQTQAAPNKGYSFLEGLRSALRQDPDVIMIGEIRDEETARVAIDAALTGHLVFSTLHTNNAAGAFTRLIDLGVNPKVLTSAVMAAMAQRLIRKLCDNCRKKVPIDGKAKELVDKHVENMRKKGPVDYKGEMWLPVGCDQCNGIGYKGRVGVYEAILSTAEIENVVRQSPSEREIKRASEPQGIYSMQEDGVLKLIKGTTSFEELQRVIDLTIYDF
jgi:type IV pilus assembly protein PilB